MTTYVKATINPGLFRVERIVKIETCLEGSPVEMVVHVGQVEEDVKTPFPRSGRVKCHVRETQLHPGDRHSAEIYVYTCVDPTPGVAYVWEDQLVEER